MFRRYRTHTEIVTGIDIGSTAIRVAVGQLHASDVGKETVQILGAIETPSEGMHKGVIRSIDEMVSSVSHALEQVERLTGVPIERAWIGISGMDILSQQNKGVVAVAKPDGDISPEDVDRVVGAARSVAPPLNYELIHLLPRRYAVDGQTGIKDPVGMTGIRLEVDAYMVYTSATQLAHLTKAVHRTGIDIEGVVLSVLAAAHAVVTERQKELGVMVVSIGGSMTSIVVYEEGEVIHVATIPIGSEHITNDLALGLRTSIDIAERVKIEYGHCVPKQVSKKDTVDLHKLGQAQSELVKLSYIAAIIEARVLELFEKIEIELDRVSRRGLLPAGVVCTGGGAALSGLVDVAKQQLGLPASIGYASGVQSMSDKIHHPAFATAIGLVSWMEGHVGDSSKEYRMPFRSTGKAIQKLRQFWQSLIP